MRSANPILNTSMFSGFSGARGDSMTILGTVRKIFALLALVVLSSGFTWYLFATQGMQVVTPLMLLGAIGGFIVALVTIFKKEWAGITSPIYAVLQGLFIGGLSSMLETQYPGVVIQAVGLTFGTLFCLLGAYRSGLIRATEKFKLGVISATGGIAVFYLVSFLLSLFGMDMSFMHGSGLFSIGLSLVVVVIAALNLVLDFDFIEQASYNGAPKYMEWVGAFGLMVTLIWLYIEILRLLVKLMGRRSE
jgi:uncharacterized YccA/Bax inhibitor family protein